MHRRIILSIVAALAAVICLFAVNIARPTVRPETETVETAQSIRFVDPDGAPVPGVLASVCDDSTCTVLTADESGVVRFTGDPGGWSVQILKTPEGFTFADGEKLPLDEEGETVIVLGRE